MNRLHTLAPLALALLAIAGPARAQAQAGPDAARQQELVRMVRQDCGSCHGMRLTGGLGPALTPAQVAGIPLENMVSIIYHGRPGTPMPGWQSLISEAEARWISEQLRRGFPEETP